MAIDLELYYYLCCRICDVKQSNCENGPKTL